MKTFEVIDISGDVGLRAYGENLKDAFINAAIGMFSLITDLEMVKEEKAINVSVESDSVEGLVVSWLNELVFYFDTYGFLGKKVSITEFTPSQPVVGREQQASLQAYKLKASLAGEDFDPERHESKLLVKAATYHRLRIDKKNDIWEIDVIFDI
ncbi:MAG TPA: archease [Thermodesulfovibrionales bacterium]|nr:archease [Thermodesulfovibrionales bacterium]